MENNQNQNIPEDSTVGNKDKSRDGNSKYMNTNDSGFDEPIKTWKQLTHNEKTLEKSLNQVVEAAIDLQCEFAALITKTATLFDPTIIEVITGGPTIKSSPEGETCMDEKEVEDKWDQKLEDFDQMKRKPTESESHPTS